MKAGDLVVYIKGKAAEIGKIKLITPGGLWAAVWFHMGETVLAATETIKRNYTQEGREDD